MLKTPPPRRLTFRARRRRRHWFAALLALAVIAAGAVYLTVYVASGAWGGEEGRSGPSGSGEEGAPAGSEKEPGSTAPLCYAAREIAGGYGGDRPGGFLAHL